MLSFPPCTPDEILNISIPDMYDFVDWCSSSITLRNLVDLELGRQFLMDEKKSLLMWSYAAMVNTADIQFLFEEYTNACRCSRSTIIKPLARTKTKLGCEELTFLKQ